jgi:hypothetical protein
MIIDETIYPAIADETLTIEQVCAAMLQVRDAIEIRLSNRLRLRPSHRASTRTLRREIETHARDLAASRAQRLKRLG